MRSTSSLLSLQNKATWLDTPDWNRIREAIPIACVDVLPFQPGAEGVRRVGLIFRETPHQGRRWCLIGGRLLRNESFAEAISRQIVESLGPKAIFRVTPDVQPVYVAQYFTVPRAIGSFDPRQHATGLIFCVPLEGEYEPQGEALDFGWFAPDTLPNPSKIGFEQEAIIKASLRRLDTTWNLDKTSE